MAQAISDYPTLQAAFENYVVRTDLSEFMPHFVQTTEAWLNRRLRTREMLATTGIAGQVGGIYTLPTDYLEWVAATWVGADNGRPLSLRYVEPDSPEFRHRYRPNGSPQYFSILGDALQTRSTQGGTLTFVYYRAIPALTATSPTNWLITKASELYLYGVIAEAYRFQKDEARAVEWAGQADARLLALMGQGDSQKVARRPARAAEDAAEATARATPN